MNRMTTLLMGASMLLASAAFGAKDPDWAQRLGAAHGAAYLEAREALLELDVDERARLAREALEMGADRFEAAGLLLGALAWPELGASCRSRVYDLRGLDAERARFRRRQDPEAASHLRSAVRSGCAALVLELALRPELYELEVSRSLAPEQRDALDRGLVIALGGAQGAPVLGYLASRANDPSLAPMLRRRALEALGRVGGALVTVRLRAVADDPRGLPQLRAGALVGLGLGGDPAARPSLSVALRHKDPTIASAALVGLSALAAAQNPHASDGLRREVSAVLVARLAEVDEAMSPAVVDALAYVAHPSALEDLRRLRVESLAPRFDVAERRLLRAGQRAGGVMAGGPEVPATSPKRPEAAPR